jgi:hypothetical protein
MATSAEQLILRGLHIMMRTTFSPNDPTAQAKHFAGLQADIGPWFKDYSAEMEQSVGASLEGSGGNLGVA